MSDTPIYVVDTSNVERSLEAHFMCFVFWMEEVNE